MNFLKKLFKSSKKDKKQTETVDLNSLSLDELFVQKFIGNGGKFLYCTSLNEVTSNLNHIIKENNWQTVICNDNDLLKLIKVTSVTIKSQLDLQLPIFVSCEHLIAENGSILFSSNQLKGNKLATLSNNFIVYATTSQLVKTKGESLTGINTRYRGNIPSNISAVKNYTITAEKEEVINYGNRNSKNLYLLLFEDL